MPSSPSVRFSLCLLHSWATLFVGDGIRVDTQKIEVVHSWPRSTSPTDNRNFFGLDGYYKRFVKGSNVSRLL